VKKLCIVPFTAQEMPLLDFLKKQYIIESVISPKGIGFEGEDISILTNCQKVGISFTNEVNHSIECCDTVVVTAVNSEMKSLRAYALAALKCAITNSKEVYCFLDLENSEKEEMKHLCKSYGAKLIIYSDDEFEVIENDGDFSLQKFDAPVIYICEEVPDCDGYSVFLKLAQKFKDKGKKVLAISSDRYNKLLGHTYLDFNVKSSITSQLNRVNSIVHDLEQTNHPDIILIKLPYPLMRYNDEFVFDCGVSAYLIAQAVPGDGCIYCSQAEPFTEDVWKTYSQTVLARFGYPLLAVHVSNRFIDGTGNEPFGLVRIPLLEILKRLKDMKDNTTLPFFNLFFDEQLEELAKYIISEFLDLPYGVIK